MRISQIIVAVASVIGFTSAQKEAGEKTFKIGVHLPKGTGIGNYAAAASAPLKYLKADKTLTTDKASGVDCTLKGSTILCDGKAMKTTIMGDMGGSLSFAGTSGSAYAVDSEGWIKMSPSRQFYLSPGAGSGIQVENCPHGHVSPHGYPKAYYI